MTTPERVYLVPARDGLKVPMPERGGAPLPAEGAWVVESSHWVRRLRDGDVKHGTPPSEKPATKTKA